jgi:hypothetical protein
MNETPQQPQDAMQQGSPQGHGQPSGAPQQGMPTGQGGPQGMLDPGADGIGSHRGGMGEQATGTQGMGATGQAGGPQGACMHHPGSGPQAAAAAPHAAAPGMGMHNAWGGPQAAAAAYGYAPYSGYYDTPPQGWPPYPYPPGYAPAQAGAAPNAFSTAMNDLAEQNGLGMFKNFLNLDDGDFWKGALVGAAVALLISNQDLRNSLIGGAAKTARAVKSKLGGGTGEQTQDSNDEQVEQTDQENEQ